MKATNSKFVREKFILDSPATVDEVSKGIAQLKNKKQVVIIWLVMKRLRLDLLQF